MITHNQKAALIDAATAVRKKAYAPYSQFLVGASVMCDDGEIFGGCNIENASFGATICAERVAIGSAIAAGKRNFLAVCVATVGAASPCGICRQFICEFGDQIQIILVDAETGQVWKEFSIAELLPDSFDFDVNR